MNRPTETTVTPFLMFQDGRAEEAMQFYVSLFDDAEIVSVNRFGPEGPGEEGRVAQGTLKLAGQTVMFLDSPAIHEFDFTPSTSLFVTAPSAEVVDRLFEALSEDGHVLMPLDAYPFSPRYAWLEDRFGVSWQLSAGAPEGA